VKIDPNIMREHFAEMQVSIQIALGAGARVIMTSSSDDKVEAVRQHLGGLITSKDRFLTINRRTHPETDKEVARLTDGKLADFLIEIGGIRTLPASIRSVKRGGFIALTGFLSDEHGDDGPTEGRSSQHVT
jgi:NADPH:quinone reductase-like Zn-dependent oxidoreductase